MNGTAGKYRTWEENLVTSFLQSIPILCLLTEMKEVWSALSMLLLIFFSRHYCSTSSPFPNYLEIQLTQKQAGEWLLTSPVFFSCGPKGIRTKENPPHLRHCWTSLQSWHRFVRSPPLSTANMYFFNILWFSRASHLIMEVSKLNLTSLLSCKYHHISEREKCSEIFIKGCRLWVQWNHSC